MPPLYNGKNTKTNTSQHFSWYRQRTGHVTVLSFYRFWWNKLDLHWSAEKSITWQIEFGWGKTFDSAPIVFSHSTSLPSFGKISDSTAFPSPPSSLHQPVCFPANCSYPWSWSSAVHHMSQLLLHPCFSGPSAPKGSVVCPCTLRGLCFGTLRR